ncbi:hypothetical protein CDAR_29611 [Caerostris darwini]|uniref:Uncharacterized protein n=1 Tax=Caerostris darwini TaxID=1538125 RepID=A0AAV4QSP2_9ARAC|nr:hypothetical protein CDAR_29611 [Caerostris darwini]
MEDCDFKEILHRCLTDHEELVRYCDFITSSGGERRVLICFGYLKRIKDDYGGRQSLVGEGEFHYFVSHVSHGLVWRIGFMDWFELNVFDVTGVVLLIGFVGKKLKDSGYDWTDYFPFFMIFIRLKPNKTLLLTGVTADTIETRLNSWDAIKAFLRL